MKLGSNNLLIQRLIWTTKISCPRQWNNYITGISKIAKAVFTFSYQEIQDLKDRINY